MKRLAAFCVGGYVLALLFGLRFRSDDEHMLVLVPSVLACVGSLLWREQRRKRRLKNATFDRRAEEATKLGAFYIGESLRFRTDFSEKLIARNEAQPAFVEPTSFAAVGDSASGKSVFVTSLLSQVIREESLNRSALEKTTPWWERWKGKDSE